MNENITLQVSDGTIMRAYVARPLGAQRPAAAPRAGIIVFQEAFGVNAHIRSIADRFAAEGYLAIAPELFHRTGDGVDVGYTDYGSAAPHMEAMTDEDVEVDARAAYEWLASELKGDAVAAIGVCRGGRVAYQANSVLPLKAAVSFYGGGIAPDYLDRAAKLHGPMLFFWGGKDAHIPREVWSQIPAALDAVGKSHVSVEMGDGGHGFFCDAREAYHKESSAFAWPLVLNFLSQKLG